MSWQQIFYIIIAAVILFFLYRYIRKHPESFSRESLGKSFWTLGVLALILVGFVGLLMVMLR